MSKEIEALKRIETIFTFNREYKPNYYKEFTNSEVIFYQDFNLVLKALIKAQEQEKVLEALKSKGILYTQVKFCKSVNEYNDLIEFSDFDKLTEEEFDLAKRWFDVSSK